MIRLEKDLISEEELLLREDFKFTFGLNYSKRIMDQLLGLVRVHGIGSLTSHSKKILDYSIKNRLISEDELDNARTIYLERYSLVNDMFN